METREEGFNGIIKLSSVIFNYFLTAVKKKRLKQFKNKELNYENKNLFLYCFARIKIKNETFEPLACYVAIDGHKVKFKLQGQSSSRWISATDKRFNYQNFSSWCDYLELHPNYQAY